MCHFASKYPGKLNLLASGPLTNIAKAIIHDDNFLDNIGRIVWMGGNFEETGNVNNNNSEFNA